MELVPIKVKIGLKPNGQARYPDFNSLASVQVSGLDWSRYIDINGSGWKYDKCGHRDTAPGSPVGQQWGLLLIPADFAAEAVAAFPAKVSILSEAEAASFYDNEHAKHFDSEILDDRVLNSIHKKQKIQPAIPLTAHQLSALDPLTDTPGVRKNHNKTFADYIAKNDITIAP
jgi:hypothetical protein